jgi:hypothetical protein
MLDGFQAVDECAGGCDFGLAHDEGVEMRFGGVVPWEDGADCCGR